MNGIVKYIPGKTRIWVAGLVLLGAFAGAANAHSFSVALAGAATDATDLRYAVQGFLVASAERDAHPDETADGHIGGLDVFVIPLADGAVMPVDGLIGDTPRSYDIVVDLGQSASDLEGVPGIGAATIYMEAGTLPDDFLSTDFAARFSERFGVVATQASARGYNAAVRLDRAIRPVGGLSEADAIRDALAASKGGIDW